MIIIGSQRRETLKESGYRVIDKPYPRHVILEDKETGKQEVWFLNDHASCYVIEIRGKGYEFARSLDVSAYRKRG